MSPTASTPSSAGGSLPAVVITYLLEAERMRWEYRVNLDAVSLELVNPPVKPAPPWTQLEFKQCSHCPLKPKRHPSCPLALHLAGLIERCSALISYEDVHVTVTTPQRTIVKRTTAQRAIGSLMGLIMATSGCPHTRYFRPMARFHLPFADEQETIYRSASSYLLAQFLRKHEGMEPDFEMEGLKKIYLNIQTLNSDFSIRLGHAVEQDASMNALVFLDLLAQYLTFSLEDSLGEFRDLFAPYLDPSAPAA